MLTIVLTALTTLIVTVAAGVLLDYIRNRKPRLEYSLQDAVPFKIGDKYFGAYVVELRNPSSTTVKDLTLSLEVERASVRSGGVERSTGLNFKEKIENGHYQIDIPYLKKGEYLSAIVICEASLWILSPELAVRSPDAFSRVERDKAEGWLKSSARRFSFAGVVGATSVLVAFTGGPQILSGNFASVRDVTMLAADAAKLPDVVELILNQKEPSYHDLAMIAYARAIRSPSPEERQRYKHFLELMLTGAGWRIASTSKCLLLFNLSRVEALLSESEASATHLTEATKECPSFIAWVQQTLASPPEGRVAATTERVIAPPAAVDERASNEK